MAENDLPDAGLLYRPRYWPKDKPWEPDAGKCRAAVSPDPRWPAYHQCSRNAKITRRVLHHGKAIECGYCGVHDPIAVASKNAARSAKWEAEWAAKGAERNAKREAAELAERAIEAIRQIAAGHNDPRSLAMEVLNPTAPAHREEGDGA